MKTYTIEVEDTIGEFFEEVAGILSKPVAEVMCDALFICAEEKRQALVEMFAVNLD